MEYQLFNLTKEKIIEILEDKNSKLQIYIAKDKVDKGNTKDLYDFLSLLNANNLFLDISSKEKDKLIFLKKNNASFISVYKEPLMGFSFYAGVPISSFNDTKDEKPSILEFLKALNNYAFVFQHKAYIGSYDYYKFKNTFELKYRANEILQNLGLGSRESYFSLVHKKDHEKLSELEYNPYWGMYMIKEEKEVIRKTMPVILKSNLNRFMCFSSVFNADKFKKLYGNPKTKILTKGKDYTFGLEIEAISSGMNMTNSELCAFDCVRDGSMNSQENWRGGPEFVTNVLQGDDGMLKLQKICHTLQSNTRIDKTCGIHVHIGGFQNTTENVVLSYLLGKAIEDDLFKHFPVSRRKNAYCKPLPNLSSKNIKLLSKSFLLGKKDTYRGYLDDLQDEIFELALAGISKTGLSQQEIIKKFKNKENNHPKGSRTGYNKNNIRYCWLNFIPFIYNTRGNKVYTLEFRPHSASLNYNKLKNWVLFCMAFVSVVENNKKEILEYVGQLKSITVSELLELAYGKKATALIKYFDTRKETFKEADVYSEQREYGKLANKNKDITNPKKEILSECV